MYRSVDESTEARRQLQKIILHPDYNKGHKYNNDIAMLKLDMPVLLTKFISPVCLPQQGQKVRIGKRCFISGKCARYSVDSVEIRVVHEIYTYYY